MVLSSKLLFKFKTILKLWLCFLVRKFRLQTHSLIIQLLKILRVARVATTRNNVHMYTMKTFLIF